MTGSVRQMQPIRLRQQFWVAMAYLITAKLGFQLALEHTNATVLWPPTGIALAACLLVGARIWPGIFVGALLANLLIITKLPFDWAAALAVSATTAVGNTLEAVVGAWLVRRFTGTAQPLERPWDTINFILLGVLLSPMISATIGASSFSAYSGRWPDWTQIWSTWWLGDAVGALVFAPLMLCWEKRHSFNWDVRKIIEALVLLGLLTLVELILFRADLRLEYLVFPLLFWIAFRFGPFESAVTVVLVMVSFLYWTSQGLGPFIGGLRNHVLLLLQSYLGVVSASILLISSLVYARRQAVEQVRQYRDNLELEVQHRTAELQETNQRLVQEIQDRSRAERELALAKERAESADHSKSAFLATMSHELRTPLNSIIGFTGILLQRLCGSLNDEQEKQLQMVRTSANHLLSLISDVLDISKIEAGQLTVARDPFNLRESVLKVAQTIRPLAEKKGLELSVAIAAEVSEALGDVRRVEQILLNLLSNAVKFTEQGSIHVACYQEEGRYLTMVSDTGIGIKEIDLAGLFKPFKQVDSGLNRKYEGTGLGLSICKRLAELMGGTVGVRSSFGAGSTFWFSLPLIPQQIQEQPPQVADELSAPRAPSTQLVSKSASIPSQSGAGIGWLLALLQNDDLLAVEWFEQQASALREVLADNFQTLEDAIRRFDYATARTVLAACSQRDSRLGKLPYPDASGTAKASVLVVDDIPNNIILLGAILKDLYLVKVANSGEQAIRIAHSCQPPDLILLDVMMPDMDGYEVCRQLKDDAATRDMPVVFLTARTEVEDEKYGLELGAVDYITKPFSPAIVLARVQNQLALKRAADFLRDKNQYLEQEVCKRTEEIRTIQEVTILALASLAESRDTATGNHLRRTQQYVRLLALQLQEHPRFSAQLSDAAIAMLFKSAPLHDIGKVGVPDRILLKPGPLDPGEFEIMKTHTTIGVEAIEQAERSLGTRVEYLRIAKEIIRHHQEKWDGSGYPDGLAGEAISVYSRLMAVADVYDALISRRAYRQSAPHDEVVRIIQDSSGSHFDPDVVTAFMQVHEEFRVIAQRFADSESA